MSFANRIHISFISILASVGGGMLHPAAAVGAEAWTVADSKVTSGASGTYSVSFNTRVSVEGFFNKHVSVAGNSGAWFTPNGRGNPDLIYVIETIRWTGKNISVDVNISRTPGVTISPSSNAQVVHKTYYNNGVKVFNPGYNYVASGYITGVDHWVQAYYRYGNQWYGPVTAYKNQSTWH